MAEEDFRSQIDYLSTELHKEKSRNKRLKQQMIAMLNSDLNDHNENY